jgi:hypothetical protein
MTSKCTCSCDSDGGVGPLSHFVSSLVSQIIFNVKCRSSSVTSVCSCRDVDLHTEHAIEISIGSRWALVRVG